MVFGLAYLAFAMAVAVRFGAIPFHLWAARLTDAAPETALPIITVLAPASLAIVGLAWTDASIAPLLVDLETERMVVLGVAIASIVLAALAALVQDDLEHVVGYSIVGDAGVVLLAMAVLEPAGWAPARTWILVFIVTRSAFAAWAGGIRAVFRTGRIDDLRGWVIRSPILAVAFGLVVAAGVGLPGLMAFEARSSLVSLALDGPLATLVLVGTFAPLAYYGRLLAVGLGRPVRPIDPATSWRPRIGRLDLTSPVAWIRSTWDLNRAFSAAVIAALLGMLALATSVGAFGGPEAAAGLPAILEGPIESFAPPPVGSGEPSFQPIPPGSRARSRGSALRGQLASRRLDSEMISSKRNNRADRGDPRVVRDPPGGSFRLAGTISKRRQPDAILAAGAAVAAGRRSPTRSGRAPSDRSRARNRAARPARTRARARSRQPRGRRTRGRCSAPSRARSRRGSCPAPPRAGGSHR